MIKITWDDATKTATIEWPDGSVTHLSAAVLEVKGTVEGRPEQPEHERFYCPPNANLNIALRGRT